MNHVTLERFTRLCRSVGLPSGRVSAVFADLVRHYSEPHRSYHNLAHIDRMLGWLDATGEGSDAVELAIWFHDVIYEPLGRENEAASARHFQDQVGQFIGAPTAAAVERLILATEPGRPRSGKQDEDLLIDIDLSVLGAVPEGYEAYRQAIRLEYAMVPKAKFAAGRAKVLRHFLSGRIYATGFFAKLERQARINLGRELGLLETEF